MFIFDEPSSFLDIKQRINAAKMIKEMSQDEEFENYVVIVEHDLAVLEFMSDHVHLVYGEPSVYGVITKPLGVREGINSFLEGFIRTENLRFRKEALMFDKNSRELETDKTRKVCRFEYPAMVKKQGDFELEIEAGNFTESEVIVLLGENGTGKTTFMKLMAGKIESDDGKKLTELSVSFKPQELQFNMKNQDEITVQKLLYKFIAEKYVDPVFTTEVLKPLKILQIAGNTLDTLSGGEVQRVAIALCLGTSADVYLLDEPSAFLDSEQRLIASKVLKNFAMNQKKTCFIVEHDFMMGCYLADRVISFTGEPGKKSKASSPKPFVEGMNGFLASMGVTFRRDKNNFRPKINKFGSVPDREQKKEGKYFLWDL